MLERGQSSIEDLDVWIRSLAERPRETELGVMDRAIVEYSLKLTDRPGTIVDGDVEALRLAGLGDRAIHDLASIVAYFAFVNRLADGLGVELER